MGLPLRHRFAMGRAGGSAPPGPMPPRRPGPPKPPAPGIAANGPGRRRRRPCLEDQPVAPVPISQASSHRRCGLPLRRRCAGCSLHRPREARLVLSRQPMAAQGARHQGHLPFRQGSVPRVNNDHLRRAVPLRLLRRAQPCREGPGRTSPSCRPPSGRAWPNWPAMDRSRTAGTPRRDADRAGADDRAEACPASLRDGTDRCRSSTSPARTSGRGRDRTAGRDRRGQCSQPLAWISLSSWPGRQPA